MARNISAFVLLLVVPLGGCSNGEIRPGDDVYCNSPGLVGQVQDLLNEDVAQRIGHSYDSIAKGKIRDIEETKTDAYRLSMSCKGMYYFDSKNETRVEWRVAVVPSRDPNDLADEGVEFRIDDLRAPLELAARQFGR